MKQTDEYETYSTGMVITSSVPAPGAELVSIVRPSAAI